MTVLGFHALAISFVLMAYSMIVYAWGFKIKSANLVNSGKRATIASFLLVTLASAALLYALLTRDFSIEYVAHYSNSSLSWFYTIAAFWAGQAGSLLLWAWLLTVFAFLMLIYHKDNELLPVAMSVMSFVTLFFLTLLVFKTSPFEKLPFMPQDGTGLNPLLQNIMMVFHPPSLYLGFVGFTVPFAFTVAALFSNNFGELWMNTIRRWVLYSWLFLTIGNILGMQWAYVELGWGGYWAWDPVENSSFLPWLSSTAFLHSIMVQRYRGMMKRWNVALIALTFALTIFGTFVTRSGLISSVHAFGVSDIGPIFLGFLIIVTIGSTALIFIRPSLLKSKDDIESWSSKESSFLLNNIFFVIFTLIVFVGTILPSISEWITGQKITVGADFFNRMATPIGMAIFVLMGICTLLIWKKTSRDILLKNLPIPVISTVLVTILLVILGMRSAKAILAFAIGVFTIAATKIILFNMIKARTKQSGSWLKALWLISQKHGGYIVHIGMMLFFIGLAGSSAFPHETTKTVQVGQTINAKGFDLIMTGIERIKGADRFTDRALFDVHKNGKKIDTIKADKLLFNNFSPATEVGIRSTLTEDIYVILADYDLDHQIATVSVLVNPLVLWIWIGGIVMVIGTVLAASNKIRGKKE